MSAMSTIDAVRRSASPQDADRVNDAILASSLIDAMCRAEASMVAGNTVEARRILRAAIDMTEAGDEPDFV